jgi:hypothetical protein
MPTLLHAATRETPAEYAWPYECAVCTEPCDDETLVGNCDTCYAPICDAHERHTVSTLDRTLYCTKCAEMAKLRACEGCDWLFPKDELTYGVNGPCYECRECIEKQEKLDAARAERERIAAIPVEKLCPVCKAEGCGTTIETCLPCHWKAATEGIGKSVESFRRMGAELAGRTA